MRRFAAPHDRANSLARTLCRLVLWSDVALSSCPLDSGYDTRIAITSRRRAARGIIGTIRARFPRHFHTTTLRPTLATSCKHLRDPDMNTGGKPMHREYSGRSRIPR